MKLFKTNSLQIIMACQENFGFRLPGKLIASRTEKLESSHCLLENKLFIFFLIISVKIVAILVYVATITR